MRPMPKSRGQGGPEQEVKLPPLKLPVQQGEPWHPAKQGQQQAATAAAGWRGGGFASTAEDLLSFVSLTLLQLVMLLWVAVQLCNRSTRGRRMLKLIGLKIHERALMRAGGGIVSPVARGAPSGPPAHPGDGAGGTPWRRGGTRHRVEQSSTSESADSRLLGEI